DDGTRVRVVCGDFWGKRGPVEGVAADPRYLDIWVPPGKRKTLKVEVERHAFAYVFEGSGNFRAASQPFGVLTEKTDGANDILVREQTGNRSLVLFDSGDEITVQAGDEGIRFILVSGKPIKEPVAWHGPIVMNSQAELQQAFTELRHGTFIREPAAALFTSARRAGRGGRLSEPLALSLRRLCSRDAPDQPALRVIAKHGKQKEQRSRAGHDQRGDDVKLAVKRKADQLDRVGEGIDRRDVIEN